MLLSTEYPNNSKCNKYTNNYKLYGILGCSRYIFFLTFEDEIAFLCFHQKRQEDQSDIDSSSSLDSDLVRVVLSAEERREDISSLIFWLDQGIFR